MPTYYPKFVMGNALKIVVTPPEVICSDRSASYAHHRMHYASDRLIEVLQRGVCDDSSEERQALLFPPPKQGLSGLTPSQGWSLAEIPDGKSLISDSGKLSVLDTLLARLKKEGHRVLIYSQMTKMIDLLVEFMKYRAYSYMRLDGSSKISDRRDMVADFQSKDDIFAFLLSTRAGGLGINLTAADTVIFYDSDWNPTVDQQAMDRAHRLGQTRQVTVYRLVTKGSIEEKILQRAREKSEIQNIVISGGQFRPDALRPKEVVSLLLDDDEMEAKLKQKQLEKQLNDEMGKRPGRKRKPVDPNKPVEEKVKKKRGRPSKGDSNTPTPVKEISAENSPVAEGISIMEGMDENSMSSGELAGLDDSIRSLEGSSRNSSPKPEGSKRGRGRGGSGGGRGRPKGRGGKPKTGALAKAAAAAAAKAGAAAGSAAAFAAYGFTFQPANTNE